MLLSPSAEIPKILRPQDRVHQEKDNLESLLSKEENLHLKELRADSQETALCQKFMSQQQLQSPHRIPHQNLQAFHSCEKQMQVQTETDAQEDRVRMSPRFHSHILSR